MEPKEILDAYDAARADLLYKERDYDALWKVITLADNLRRIVNFQ